MLEKNRLWESVQTLGEIGETEDGAMMRVTGSQADKTARDLLVEWFEDAGLTVLIDPVGNIIARREGKRDLRPIVTGSHIDTVPAGGKFDGTVGVLGPLEVVRAWDDANIETDRPVEIVVFTEEEGTRFGVGLLGSLVASNQLDGQEALALQDDSGKTVEETLSDIGYDGSAEFDLEDAAAFVEMHVEQGPELDKQDTPIGIVDSIAGITHHSITVRGESDHAGNTPMDVRRDAFMGVAEFALAIERRVTETDGPTVGTVGRVDVSPNGTNVIPEEVKLGVDIRDADGDRLSTIVSDLKTELEAIAERRNLRLDWEVLLEVSPKSMDPRIRTELEEAAKRCSLDYLTIRSGAGHDAMNAANVTSTGMLFLPSEGGISHSPNEFTSSEDLFAGTRALDEALRSLATTKQTTPLE